MKNDEKKCYLRVMIRFGEGEEEVFEQYDFFMKGIIRRAEMMAINSLTDLQRMVQSEIMNGNRSGATGMLNKRYDVLVKEQYYKLCSESDIPNNVVEIYARWLPVYC